MTDEQRFLYLEDLRAKTQDGKDVEAIEELPNEQKQDLARHLRNLQGMPCWMCGTPTNRYQAAQMVDIPKDHPVDGYRCSRCGVPMMFTVPARMLPLWLWLKPPKFLPNNAIETVEALTYTRILYHSAMQITDPEEGFSQIFDSVGDHLPPDLTLVIRYTRHADEIFGMTDWPVTLGEAKNTEEVLRRIAQMSMTQDVIDIWRELKAKQEASGDEN